MSSYIIYSLPQNQQEILLSKNNSISGIKGIYMGYVLVCLVVNLTLADPEGDSTYINFPETKFCMKITQKLMLSKQSYPLAFACRTYEPLLI